MPVVVDVHDYRDLYRKTRMVGGDIRRELPKRLRAAGKIGADASRAKIRDWPVAGGISAKAGGRVHRGLRARLAFNVRVSATGRNVLIRSGARGLTGQNAEDLPRDIDRGGWYHPVFGRKPADVLSGAVSQRTRGRRGQLVELGLAGAARRGLVFQHGWPYFKKEIASKYQPMTDEVAKVLDDIARRLT